MSLSEARTNVQSIEVMQLQSTSYRSITQSQLTTTKRFVCHSAINKTDLRQQRDRPCVLCLLRGSVHRRTQTADRTRRNSGKALLHVSILRRHWNSRKQRRLWPGTASALFGGRRATRQCHEGRTHSSANHYMQHTRLPGTTQLISLPISVTIVKYCMHTSASLPNSRVVLLQLGQY